MSKPVKSSFKPHPQLSNRVEHVECIDITLLHFLRAIWQVPIHISIGEFLRAKGCVLQQFNGDSNV